MTFAIEVGSRQRTVRVSGGRGSYTVLLDDTRYDVDAARIGDSWSLLVGRRSHEVICSDESSGTMTVHVNGRAVPLRLSSEARRRTRSRPALPGGADAAADLGPVLVAAPMPGRIVKVHVRPGDVVAGRQGLVVIEAMKMENELRAPRPGTVKEVRVAEGALVEARTVVVVIE